MENIHKENHRLGDQGFTLIEVLVAMAIFSIGILAVGNLYMSTGRGNTSARGISDGAEWASDRIELLLTRDYDHTELAAGVLHTPTADDPTTDGLDNDYDGQVDEAGEAGSMSISWTIQEVVPDANTDIYNYKILIITVNWSNWGGNKSVTMQNIVPKIV